MGIRLRGQPVRARISIDGTDPIGGTTIEVNGQRIEGAARSLRISQSAGGFPEISVDLALVDRVDVEGDITVVMTRAVRDALIALGWTPPEG